MVYLTGHMTSEAIIDPLFDEFAHSLGKKSLFSIYDIFLGDIMEPISREIESR